MGSWFTTYWPQLLGVASVLILLSVGRKKIMPGVKQNKILLWLAFAVTAVCGLILGWALFGVMGWLTALPGLFGGVVGSVGAIVAVAAGWWSIAMIVDLIRDVADGVPDEQARQAGLWVPTLAPAGVSAVFGIVANPRGIGTGLAAAVIALISIVALRRIVRAALAGKKGGKFWRWFAAGISLLAGVLMIPLLAFVDVQVGAHTAAPWPTIFRTLVGVFGAALLIGAAVDLKDKVPDAPARAFLSFGVPALFLFGAVAVSFVSGNAETGGQILIGGMQ